MRRWRGLKSLVVDAVEHGSRAVEKLQIETARVPFQIAAQIPRLAVPAKGAHAIHDTAVTATHGLIRLVTRVVGDTVDVVLDAVEKRPPAAVPPPAVPDPSAAPTPSPTPVDGDAAVRPGSDAS
jgi:hypothetical protein